ncbi:hypothetical protein EV360DRAFT_90878 [Lentinula raphanica]|nr:hypothetical protein EV360DRAFT_90878 [Lentinula raphanica]
MRYLTSSRTPSMRLFAYYCLLLFFGYASNLFTAALPAIEPDSKELITRPTNGLVPRANDETVQITWTSPLVPPSRPPTPAEKVVNIVESQLAEKIPMAVLERKVTKTLRKIFKRKKLAVQFLERALQWRTNSETFFWLEGRILRAPRGYAYYGRIKVVDRKKSSLLPLNIQWLVRQVFKHV